MKNLVLALLLIATVRAQHHACSIPTLQSRINGGNLVAMAVYFGIPTVTVLDHNIVCLSTHSTRGLYRTASVVVSYNCSDGGVGCPAG